MSKIKFAYIHNSRIPSEKAHSLYIIQSVLATDQDIYDRYLVTARYPHNEIKESIWKYYQISTKSFKFIEISIGNQWREKIWRLFPSCGSIILNIIFCLRAWVWAFRNRMGIIQTGHYELLFFINIFWFMYKPKVILDIHLDPPKNAKKWWYQNTVLVVCNTEYFFNIICKFTPNVITLPNGYNPDDFNSAKSIREKIGISQDKFVVGYIGSFEFAGQEKGVNLLIDTIKEYSKKKNDVHALIVGGPEKRAEQYRQKINEYGLEKFITLISAVNPNEVPNYIASIDIGWIVYPEVEYLKYKTSPMKLIEYMAAGKPVIGSDYPSITKIISKDSGCLISNQNPEFIASQLLGISEDELITMGESAKNEVRQYTWVNRQKKILNTIYSKKIIAIMRIKNQKLTITDCLDRLSNLVDGIVIVDNGSTDGTELIYGQYEKILEISKTNDFDEGRDKNLALQLARKYHPDWILWLDGDEIFEQSVSRSDLEVLMNDPRTGLIQFRMYNFYKDKDNHRIDGKWRQYATNPQKRLWKDTGGQYFEDRKFHAGEIRNSVGRIKTSLHRLKHFGYIEQNQINQKNKLYESLKNDPSSNKTLKYDDTNAIMLKWHESKNKRVNKLIQLSENTIWSIIAYYDQIKKITTKKR
jgi:glycosyltransferase involved in cell wall biosynthesis